MNDHNLSKHRLNFVFSYLGLAAVAKVLIAMEENRIPGNLHYTSPNPDIPGLSDGRLRVVGENTDWTGGVVGVNSFGFGGSNVHAVLKSNPHINGEYYTFLKLLVTVTTLPENSWSNLGQKMVI